jgi:hypothetical protein
MAEKDLIGFLWKVQNGKHNAYMFMRRRFRVKETVRISQWWSYPGMSTQQDGTGILWAEYFSSRDEVMKEIRTYVPISARQNTYSGNICND